jgi:segregation and condensation protein B
MTMTPIELKSALEAIIYAADEPATVEQMASAVGEEKHLVRAALDELVGSYGSDERGIEVREVAGGFRVYTKPQHHDVVRRFIKSLRPPLRLTMPALETLAVIAYKQPVTQPEIQEIRGVSAAGVIQTLLERRLITTAGRKHVIGRPILYRTSKDFLMRFGLSDLEDLPSLKEFEALAREALGAEDGVAEGEVPGEAAESTEAASADGAVDQSDFGGVSTDAAMDIESKPKTEVESEAPSAVSATGDHSENESTGPAEVSAARSAETEAEPQATPAEKAAGSGAS